MSNQFDESDQPMQSNDEIMQIITEATIPAVGTRSIDRYLSECFDFEDDDDDVDDDCDYDGDDDDDMDLESNPELDDVDSSGEIVYAI